ncbi:amino acid adenylation domain-containing protein [Paenibacillus amylolyticus]|uniref:amino acid adenylation domain-containing protein n=1 Tax=Paenibacillus amylolyticus TaxID=1451 RepID=UPI003EC0C0C2
MDTNTKNNNFILSNLTPEQKIKLAKQLKMRNQQREVSMPVQITKGRREEGELLPLSYAQEQIWFLEQYDPGDFSYNSTWSVTMSGKLDRSVFNQSVKEIVNRHEILRSVYKTVDGRPVQCILPLSDYSANYIDLSDMSVEMQIIKLTELYEIEISTPLSLESAPLLRITIIKKEEEKYILLLTMHHIVSDGLSFSILWNEIFQLYQCTLKRSPNRLEELPFQYADYACWQRESTELGHYAKELDYWKNTLTGAPEVLELPLDRPRPAIQSSKGDILRFQLSHESYKRIKELSQNNSCTLFMTLLAAFNVLLYRYTSQDDIIIGCPVSNRMASGTEKLIGCFLNNIVLRTHVRGNQTFLTLLEQVRQQCLLAYGNQNIPFEKVIEALRPQRSTSYNPVFQVMFGVQTIKESRSELGDFEVQFTEMDTNTAKFDLNISIVETENDLAGYIEYRTDLFDRETIERMLNSYQNLLIDITSDPTRVVSELKLLTPEEEQFILIDRNATDKKYLLKGLHQLFTQRAEMHPSRSALFFEGDHLSYGELNERANKLSHYLINKGVKQGSFVGISMHRSFEMIISLLAILKAGCAYVPLEPSFPKQRLQYIVNDSGLEWIITHRDVDQLFVDFDVECIHVERDKAYIDLSKEMNPTIDVQMEDPAYVLYTSGSTGMPKGVVLRHEGVSNRIVWMQDELHLELEDRVLQKTSYTFDVSVWEFFWPLSYGGGLVLAKPDGHMDPQYLVQTIIQQRVTIIHFVPSMLQLFLEEKSVQQCHSLRQVICSGEALTYELKKRCLTTLEARLFNMYGPTEASIDVSWEECSLEHLNKMVTIGKPIKNIKLHVLDANLAIVPFGVPGELFIEGVGLAKGYLNRKELTEEKFITHSFGDGVICSLYRSGDLVKLLPDGTIAYLGRLDHQVKINGLRIELGEIESVLQEHDHISDCVIIADQDHHGRSSMTGYILTDDGNDISSSILREWLLQKLPEYMIPRQFVKLEKFPLTVSGKVDRNTIAKYKPALAVQTVNAPPETELELSLSKIWEDVLSVQGIGVDDNFFELGGDSISSIRMVTKARDVGIYLTAKDIFQNQSIARLAKVAKDKTEVQAEQKKVTGEVALTPIQKWFFEQNFDEPHHWNQAMMFETEPSITVSILQEALQMLVSHHDVLRTRFIRGEEGWKQFISNEISGSILEQIDLTDIDPIIGLERIERHATICQASLDLNEQLIQCKFFNLGVGQKSRLFIAVHHLIIDAVSWRIIFEDLILLCDQAIRQKELSLTLKTTSYKEWAEKLSALSDGIPIDDVNYWRSITGKGKELPIDHSFGVATEETAHTITLRLNEEITGHLTHTLPQRAKLKVQESLIAALNRALYHWLDEANPVKVDIEGHGREEYLFDHVDVSRTVGWFTSMFPILLNIGESESIHACIQHAKEKLRSVPHKGLSYGVIKYLSDQPQIHSKEIEPSQILFNFLGKTDVTSNLETQIRMSSDPTGDYRSPKNQMPYLLEFNSEISDGKLTIHTKYSQAKFLEKTVQTLLSAWESAIHEIVHLGVNHGQAFISEMDYPAAEFSPSEYSALQSHCLAHAINIDHVEDIYLLSPMQQGLLFHTVLSPDSGQYSQQYSCKLYGELDIKAFERAWKKVIERHSILRTSFIWKGLEQPRQIVHKTLDFKVSVLDAGDLTEDEAEELRISYLKKDLERGYCLEKAPLMRVSLHRMKGDEQLFVWSHHHIILDGWSQSLLLDEVFRIYNIFCRGTTLKLNPAVQFDQYIARLQSKDITEAKQFWKSYFAGYELQHFVRGHMLQSDTTEPYKVLKYELSTDLSNDLHEFVKRNKMTQNTVFQALWALVVSRYSKSKDIVFGMVVSGRSVDMNGINGAIGLFINTLPVRIKVEESLDVLQWLQRIQEQQVELSQFEHTPLLSVQEWSGLTKSEPLFESILVYENYPMTSYGQEVMPVKVESVQVREVTNYPITVTIQPSNNVVIEISYHTEQISDYTATELLEGMKGFLLRLLENSSLYVGELNKRTKMESIELLNRLSPFEPVQIQKHQAIYTILEEQARLKSHESAVVCGEESITYQYLNEQSNRLARYLLQKGVGSEHIVGVWMDRSIAAVISIMAISKAGGAFLPMDSAFPKERIKYMVEDSRTAFVLTNHEEALAETCSAELININNLSQELAKESLENINKRIQPESLAYVIYTSGTTGRPKGVMVEHQNVLSVTESWKDKYELASREVRILQLAGISFDVFTGDFMRSLIGGGTLIICPDHERLELPSVHKLLLHHQVTLFESTPALIIPLMEYIYGNNLSLPDLQLLILGSDKVSDQDFRQLVQRFGNHVEIVNSYGVTEATIDSSYYSSKYSNIESHYGNVPIGKPLPNSRYYILDEEMEPVPVGVEGELYIGGKGVARGYLHNIELTQERFLPDPFLEGGRIYKTGDIARWTEQEVVEFIGREDGQVKVGGIRIEVGEIESVLNRIEGVEASVVLVIGDGIHKYLYAFYVGDARLDNLKMELARRLPRAFVPTRFKCLKEFPLTLNGKLDRRALLVLAREEKESLPVYPKTQLESELIEIWGSILDIKISSIHDSFFDLGGNSILLLKLYNVIDNRYGVPITVADLFAQNTIHMLAHFIQVKSNQSLQIKDSLDVIMEELRAGKITTTAAEQRISNL